MIHKTTRSILSVLLAALLLVTSIPLTPAFAGGGGVSLQSESGEGRALKPVNGEYQIYTADDLKEFADIVNGTHAEGINQNTSANAKLMNDIDLNGSEENPWTPIGNSSQQYSGTFNGDGHTISGLYINSSSDNYQGLFGYVSGSGKVQNLTVDGTVSGSGNRVGGVVGYNSGSVINCTNTGSVSGSEYVGGVVGYNRGTVENCYNTGNVSGVGPVGGVVGSNSGTVENCYNTDSVSNGTTSGGVVGQNSGSGSVTGCYFLQQNGVPAQGIGSGTGTATEKRRHRLPLRRSRISAAEQAGRWQRTSLGTDPRRRRRFPANPRRPESRRRAASV